MICFSSAMACFCTLSMQMICVSCAMLRKPCNYNVFDNGCCMQMICVSFAMLRKRYNYLVFGNCCCIEMLRAHHFWICSRSAMQIECQFTLILNEVIPTDIYIQLCYMTTICCNAKSIWVSGKGRGSSLGCGRHTQEKKRRINVNDFGLRQALIEKPFELVSRVEAQVGLRNQVLICWICIVFFGGAGRFSYVLICM